MDDDKTKDQDLDSTETVCPRCGAELPEAPNQGLCPKCLLKLGLPRSTDDKTKSEDLDSTETVRQQSPILPERVGPYRILERLGEGGMGVVYLAEQTEPVRRKVALKIIKHGMDTKQVVARFEAERQALAMMDHPCVAKVFDAGSTEGGRPYFAMEYVQGVPITEHCDRQRLTTRERLVLFQQVCEGVQHAHQNAIIHRDLKPSNVLVSYRDGKATPKIIDFGVAKAIKHRLTEKTLYTEMGVLIGTPEYMSPEQAEMTGQNVDTRTDVYSLGVVLYELLVGALPFESKELRQAGFDEIRRKIREEEPSKPSARLSTLGGEHSTESAKRRRTDPSTLRRQLSGDLDWITMRALEKDRARRYGSPSELSDDIKRHLKHEPVLAGPPSTVYRIRKFVRRHRAGVAFSSVAVVLLLGVAMAITVLTEKAKRDDLQRIRWTLEQVLTTESGPGELRSDWNELLVKLHDENHRDPHGELALLARRAAAFVFVDLPPFGLSAELPSLLVWGREWFDPGVDLTYIADLEGSWDDGPWFPIGSGLYRGQFFYQSTPLEAFLTEEQLNLAPHQLEIKVTITLLASDFVAQDDGKGRGVRGVVGRAEAEMESDFVHGPFEQSWTSARRIPPLFVETRILPTKLLHLFAEYPEDFPRRVSDAEARRSLEHVFVVDRVRIFLVDLPNGDSPGYQFTWPGYSDMESYCTPKDRTTNVGLVVGIELTGRFDQRVEVPLAGTATLWPTDASEPVLSFPLVFASDFTRSLGHGSMFFGRSIMRADWMRADWMRADWAGTNPSRLVELPTPVPDGSIPAHLRIEPDRATAIASEFPSYFGGTLSLPILLEFVTIEGEWLEDESCAS